MSGFSLMKAVIHRKGMLKIMSMIHRDSMRPLNRKNSMKIEMEMPKYAQVYNNMFGSSFGINLHMYAGGSQNA